jgi:RNA polymerase sigma factor (sigma-70 family)
VTAFQNPVLKQLADQQVRFAPPARRQEQAARARKLLAEVDPAKQYPYQYVCFRVTDYRPDAHADLLIDGATLAHDLAEMVRLLDDPAVTLEELSKRLNVSTKTIRRWRKFGLEGRRDGKDSQRRLLFKQSAIDDFLSRHRDLVERGGRFSQLTEVEREEILCRAKGLTTLGGSLTEVSRSIARQLGRSAETVRYTIKNHDREHPDQALFPNLTGPLDADTKQVIYNSYRRGIAVDTLAKRFQRTRTSMYRVINEVRAQRLLEQPLDHIPHPSFEPAFDDPALEAEILAPMPDADAYEARRRDMHAPKDVPPELAPMYEVPLLSKEQEQHLFRQMNYLKYKAGRLRAQLRKDGGDEAEVDPSRVRIQTLRQVEDLQAEAAEVKDQLINANMRLVVNIAKRHAAQADNFFELLSDGNMSLIRAVEKFDFGRGNKFSTYASWAIMKNFARSIPEEKKRKERYVTGQEEIFDSAADVRTDEHEVVATAQQAASRVNRLLEYLDPRERQIIRMRAGLDRQSTRSMTLDEIGHELGITKERVRQLHVRSMQKLKSIAKEQHMEWP